MLGRSRLVRALDRQGRPLSGWLWDRVHHYGTQLLACGYWESTTKPNLFVRSYPSVTFFADLRGTRYITIAEDSRPLFYWNIPFAVDRDRVARMVAIEGARLAPIPIRLPSILHEEQMAVLMHVESEPFERQEPQDVPAAPAPATFRPVHRLFEALDPRTGELIASGAKGAERPYLRCPQCREPVARHWDGALDRYCFAHPRTRCPLSPV